MEIDHDGCRAWKSFDWSTTDRLYQKGFICDPANKSWFGEFEQRDKWSFCLTVARMAARQERP